MKLEYEDLLSGDLIPVEGVGYLKPPRLKDLWPAGGIGIWKYNFFLNILAWGKEKFLEYMKLTSPRQAEILSRNKELNVFDVMTLIPGFRPALTETLAFFMSGSVAWDDALRVFSVTDFKGVPTGNIDRDNFDGVRDAVLQLNYINLGDSAALKHTSKKTKDLWERAQASLKKESLKSPENKSLSLGNIISKLCAAPGGYTLLNIYDLTVFQLYDQFFQYGYLRASNLNEMAFSNHGGEKFNFQDWLKPIFKT